MKHDRIKTILLTLITIEATGHVAKNIKKVNQIMEELQCRSKGNISGGGTRAPEARAARGSGGIPPRTF